jgi:peptidoglycan/LPS O-acetylase OafA/YrhL
MEFYSVWPYFLGMAVVLLLAYTPLLKWADTPPTTAAARVRTIDGLRGLLALGVVFHHAAIYHQYLQTGKWYLPPSRFYVNLGQVGVAMFFMITSYLFWTQMLKVKGKPNLPKLYVGRVFRIVPLYLFLVVLLTVGAMTQGDDVNDHADTGLISAYVTWSLYYEWIFYASLLVMSFFARSSILSTVLPVAGLLVMAPLLQFHQNNIPLAAALMFCVGMTVASAQNTFSARPLKIPQWGLSTGIVGCLALVVLLFDGVYSTLPILILGVAFALVVWGTTLFGLLLTRSARRLGDISYGIYLLQGPVLFLMFAFPAVRSFAVESAWIHWIVVIIAALALIMVATTTHTLIERPGIHAGQWVLARIVSIRCRSAVSTA